MIRCATYKLPLHNENGLRSKIVFTRKKIAAGYGITEMLIVGLANDEVGYIVPPSDYLPNEKTPYLEKTMDSRGENHYEETNSVGPECARAIAEAFEAALLNLP